MVVGQLKITQIDAFQGREERNGRGRGATDLDDAGGGGLSGLVAGIVRWPHRAQWRTAFG